MGLKHTGWEALEEQKKAKLAAITHVVRVADPNASIS